MKVGDKINCWTIININPPPEHRYHLLCRCVCGNEKWVSRSTLRRGKSKSCGCRKHRSQKEYNLKPGDNGGCRRSDHQIKEQKEGRELGQKISREVQKHGLSVAYAGFGRRKNRNSRTGITGVSKWSDKYRAYITVDRKQINLGTFGKLEDAVKARRNAEEQYFSERQKRVDKIKREVIQKER